MKENPKLERSYLMTFLKFLFRLNILSAFLLFCWASQLAGIESELYVHNQQTVEVRGSVLDEGGLPLPGVSVLVRGTTIGTVTNLNGNYVISVPADAQVLVFSFVGMETQQISIEGRTVIDVVMLEETLVMDEIVVIGYGTQRRSEITGAISSVRGEALAKMPTGNIGQSLTGMATGLRVFDVDGDPSRDPVIQIRGETTADIRGTGGANQPLIVIDGTPGGSLRDVAPEDIESIEILKDAAAAAIFGARGANGVVLIQTRRGHEGRVVVNFDSYYKYNLEVANTPLVRQYDHVIMTAEGQIASGRVLTPRTHHEAEWLKAYPYVDHLENLARNSLSHRQRVNIAGGSADHQFRLSGTYDKEPGTTINNEYHQGTFLFASDHKIGERLAWSNTFSVRTNYRIRGFDYEPRRRLFDMVMPYQTAIDRLDYGYYDEILALDQDWGEFQASRDDISRNNIYNFNINPSFTLTDGLILSNRFSYRQNNSTDEVFNYQYVMWHRVQARNDALITHGNGYNWVNDVILNFERTFAERHSIYATGVYTAERSFSRHLRGYRSDLPLDMVPAIRLGDVATQTNDGWYNEDTRLGIVGRVGYTFDTRYVLAASVRRDASSRFTPANRWGTFPSVSFAWNIHNESFMQNIDWISNARIRASWGRLGRDKLAAYRHYSMVTLAHGYVFDNRPVSGAAISRLAYEGTGWEAVESIDLGAEAYFYDNRLNISYNYWKKTTKDLIFQESLPAYSGMRTRSVDVNAGEFLNSGHEIEFTWRDRVRQFNYNIEANVSTYHNEVLEWVFPEGVSLLTGSAMGLGGQRDCFAIEVGKPFMFFYTLETQGIWQSDYEIDAAKYHRKDDNGNFMYDSEGNPVWGWPHIGRGRPTPGSVKYVDRTGDGNIDLIDDRYHSGQRYPKAVIGINGGFEFRGFDFYFQTNSHIGASIFHELDRRNVNAFAANRVAVDLSAYRAWRGEGSTNDPAYPRYAQGINDTDFGRIGDHALHKADYFRIKALNMGYTLRGAALQRLGMNSVRVYASGYNVLTFTRYPGFDPEMGGALGHDSWSYAGFYRGYPYYNPRSFTGGVQINF